MKQSFPRYTLNLHRRDDKIFSYNTHVATIEGDKLVQHGYWTMTTHKHINYVANQLNLNLIKPEK